MANLRDIKKRIKSVKNTQQITKAMKMVSAAKLRRAEESVKQARPYANKMLGVLSSLALRADSSAHPLLARREVKKVAVIVITSDRGLCGAFNSGIIKKADSFLRLNKMNYESIGLTVVGRKAADHYKRNGGQINKEHTNILYGFGYHTAAGIAGDIINAYTNEEVDEVYLLYNEYKSALVQEAMMERLLPITPLEGETEMSVVDYIYEPNKDSILEEILPKHVEIQVYRALLESIASEHGARMAAMDSATRNAKDMIGRLTLYYNRARQATITKELVEIVSGAEALK
ncbi:MAG: ATP synthase F1, gamma subunit, partial [Deltaproteobacteria bacterium]|nr:ATP synthase F1, gamma subunit [Deltaproteobacteria bacterium]